MQIKILACIANSRAAYSRVRDVIKKDEFGPIEQQIIAEIDRFYELDPSASRADVDVIANRITRKVSSNPKLLERVQDFMNVLSSTDISTVNIAEEVLDNRRSVIGTSLGQLLLEQDHNSARKVVEEYVSLSDSSDITEHVEEEYSNAGYDELFEFLNTDGLIQVAPSTLNDALGGGARKGHHLLVFAMSEVGKTMVAINMTAGFCRHNHKVLYIGNEDPIQGIVVRMLSNISGMTEQEIRKDCGAALKKARRHGYENATFMGMSNCTMFALESVCRKHRPDVLVIDQLLNVDASGKNRVDELEMAAKGARRLASKYDILVVSVTQAADSARGKLSLNTGDVYNSNVGLPGQCDVMVGVGMDTEYYNNNRRYITLSKNKISGNHANFTVEVDPKLSRVLAYKNTTRGIANE
jgi:archaellum biogenesis ATPase FlaH